MMVQARGKREKKPEKLGGWIAVMCALLRGALAAAAAAVLVLFVCALLVSGGVIPEQGMERSVPAACVLGALTGGLLAVRQVGRSTLLVGAGVGAALFLLLLSAGWLLFDAASLSNGGAVLLSCLCGGAMAGILGSRPKKKRKR